MYTPVQVNKDKLLKKLKKNRKKHVEIFEQAQEAYRKQMIEELDRALKDAKAGKKIKRAFTLPVPENHVEDFDTVIQMLEWHQDDEIELHPSDFQQYVENKWGWQKSFTANTESYVAR